AGPVDYEGVLVAGVGDVVRAEPFEAAELAVGEIFGLGREGRGVHAARLLRRSVSSSPSASATASSEARDVQRPRSRLEIAECVRPSSRPRLVWVRPARCRATRIWAPRAAIRMPATVHRMHRCSQALPCPPY